MTETGLFHRAQAIVDSTCELPSNAHDQVWPGLFLSEASTAKKIPVLEQMGITHIINCCEGIARTQVATGAAYYSGKFVYFGICAMDDAGFDMRPFFEATHK